MQPNTFSVDPHELLEDLLQTLNLREREVLQRRSGLLPARAGRKETLEKIGKDFGVTRERIRQIENAAIKKLNKVPELDSKIQGIVDGVTTVLGQHGNVMAEDHLIDEMWDNQPSELTRSAFVFILDNLIDALDAYENDHVHRTWHLTSADRKKIDTVIKHLISLINEAEEPLEHDVILNKFAAHDHLHADDHAVENAIMAHLNLAKGIKKDVFGKWGLADWRVVSPKRMNDKIYLVLKKHGEPMHFTEIAEAIDAMNFDNKKAHPPTIHNELILDKERFVLVGRGIYGLAEHGFKHGVVADVIYDILKKVGPLTKDDLVDHVLKQRVVAKSTIYLALTNKDKFERNADGHYCICG